MTNERCGTFGFATHNEARSCRSNAASIARRMGTLIGWNVTFVRPEPTIDFPGKWCVCRPPWCQELSESGSASGSQGVSGPPNLRMKVLGATPGVSGSGVESILTAVDWVGTTVGRSGVVSA